MLRGRGREHEEPVGVQSRDRPVVLDPAALVEEERVDQAADRHVHVVRADMLEEPERVRPVTSILANELRSKSATASRAARCSSAAYGNQFCRPNGYS